ncbi:hypothetical protein GZ77_19285 [Endozoicomonas montiporae]|uniref:Lysine transporter LysE n=2 Tax=Endozoicomonas montiporae TaxID=1027273 RepID=A0A081N2H0_9GAMM|nr:LysE family transporter [Endozoicomonas montiporae]AMO58390.1 putative threonine efflux protein [Endozoicomonas montiporae CL-33]KEQ12643.1 hypothetical protein GZ77_19285 [Endozoicomonas montiporae]
MFDLFLKGIIAGIVIAAPVGPIGLLCLRRTLENGRLAGLASGLGAATADGFYGVVVAAGFAVSGVLDSHAGQMSVVGGLLVTILGLQALRGFLNNKDQSANSITTTDKTNILSAFSTTFILTLTNPMTILMFTGLIAGLGSIAESESYSAYWLVCGIFLGSAIWWIFLVHITLLAKSRLTAAVTRWFDFVSGTLLLFWGLWLLFNNLL